MRLSLVRRRARSFKADEAQVIERLRLSCRLGSDARCGLGSRRRPDAVGLCDHAVVRPRIHTVALPSELGDFADEVRRVFLELGRVFGAESLAGECSPPVDVYETDETIEVAVDLPGVDAPAI